MRERDNVWAGLNSVFTLTGTNWSKPITPFYFFYSELLIHGECDNASLHSDHGKVSLAAKALSVTRVGQRGHTLIKRSVILDPGIFSVRDFNQYSALL